MIPILFNELATSFNSYGIGVLSDVIECFVTEERNAGYELVMKYPVDGIYFSNIKERSLILAKPNPKDELQAFRVYNISNSLTSQVEISAEHISYDLSGFPVKPMIASSTAEALVLLKQNSVIKHDFTFWTDISNTGTFITTVPRSTRSIMGADDESLLDSYDGEYSYDNFLVKFNASRGSDKGVSIKYGINLVDAKQEKNNSEVFTGIMPYYYSNERLVTLPENVIDAVTTSYKKYSVADLTDMFELEHDEVPTEADLRAAAKLYLENNDITRPKISIDIQFAQLEQYPEFADIWQSQEVLLCDIVTVEFERLGISAKAKVIKTKYNVILERYDTVSLGDYKTDIGDTIKKINQTMTEIVADINDETATAIEKAKSDLEDKINDATDKITGVDGGYIRINKDADGNPYELLVMDEPDINTAKKIWRWNLNGLGYSSTGYNGKYSLAMTSDGKIVADFITTGTLGAVNINGAVANIYNIIANRITSGSIYSTDKKLRISLDEGYIRLYQDIAGYGCVRLLISIYGIQWAHETNGRYSSAVIALEESGQSSSLSWKELCMLGMSTEDIFTLSMSDDSGRTVFLDTLMLTMSGSGNYSSQMTSDGVIGAGGPGTYMSFDPNSGTLDVSGNIYAANVH